MHINMWGNYFYKRNLSKTITFLLFTYTHFYISIKLKEELGWEKREKIRQTNFFTYIYSKHGFSEPGFTFMCRIRSDSLIGGNIHDEK